MVVSLFPDLFPGLLCGTPSPACCWPSTAPRFWAAATHSLLFAGGTGGTGGTRAVLQRGRGPAAAVPPGFLAGGTQWHRAAGARRRHRAAGTLPYTWQRAWTRKSPHRAGFMCCRRLLSSFRAESGKAQFAPPA